MVNLRQTGGAGGRSNGVGGEVIVVSLSTSLGFRELGSGPGSASDSPRLPGLFSSLPVSVSLDLCNEPHQSQVLVVRTKKS